VHLQVVAGESEMACHSDHDHDVGPAGGLRLGVGLVVLSSSTNGVYEKLRRSCLSSSGLS
jgi:hypothetical protein